MLRNFRRYLCTALLPFRRDPIVPDDLRAKLASWAVGKPTVKELRVFGSYATGCAKSTSDLDIALDFNVPREDRIREFMDNRQSWRRELTKLTGIEVKDLELVDATSVRGGPSVEIYRRPT